MANSQSTTSALLMLAANLAVAVLKLVAAAWTNSSAMFSEAIHSLVGISSHALQHVGLRRFPRPEHSTAAAHGFVQQREREKAFWGFVVGMLLFSMGAGVSVYDGVHKFLDPQPLTDAHINYVVLAAAMVLTAHGTLQAVREAGVRQNGAGLFDALRDAKDPMLFTLVMKSIAAMVGLVAALAGVMASHLVGLIWADGLASIAISLVMALVAMFLAIELRSLITEERIRTKSEHTAGDAAPAASDDLARVPPAAVLASLPRDGELDPGAAPSGAVQGKKAKKSRRRS